MKFFLYLLSQFSFDLLCSFLLQIYPLNLLIMLLLVCKLLQYFLSRFIFVLVWIAQGFYLLFQAIEILR